MGSGGFFVDDLDCSGLELPGPSVPVSFPIAFDPGDFHAADRHARLALCAPLRHILPVARPALRTPLAFRHEPWVARVRDQLTAAYDELEAEINRRPLADTSASIGPGGVTTAVAWQFTQMMIPQIVPAATYPGLAGYSARCERLAEFSAAPHGPDTYRSPHSASAGAA